MHHKFQDGGHERQKGSCFGKNGEVKRREIVAKNMKGKTHTLLEERESRQAIHNPNSDLKLNFTEGE